MILPNYTKVLPDPKPCPVCGESLSSITSKPASPGGKPPGAYQMRCTRCGTRTNWYSSCRAAYLSWNSAIELIKPKGPLP